MGKIYSIDPTTPFLPKLVFDILNPNSKAAFSLKNTRQLLNEYTIFLPTRRAARAIRDEFLKINNNHSLLLPKIKVIGDVEEDDLLVSSITADISNLNAQDELSIPPAINSNLRLMKLSQIILNWAKSTNFWENIKSTREDESIKPLPQNLSQAFSIAKELIKLLDTMAIEDIDSQKLENIIPENYSQNAQAIIELLNMAIKEWPDILREKNLIEPIEGRNKLLHLTAKNLKTSHNNKPYIIAGSTGTIKATSELIKTIYNLNIGYIILPGLNKYMEDAEWQILNESHPQYGLKKLLNYLEIKRDEVEILADFEDELHISHNLDYQFNKSRAQTLKLIHEMMRPADLCAEWQNLAQNINMNELALELNNLNLIEAGNEHEEALVIALVVRKALEDENKKIAIISPNSEFSTLIKSQLSRWDIEVDFSGGEYLNKSSEAIFLSLSYEILSNNISADNLLSFLKHPLCNFGFKKSKFQKAILTIELGIFRGISPNGNIKDVIRAFNHTRYEIENNNPFFPDFLKRLRQEDWDFALKILEYLQENIQIFQENIKSLKDENDNILFANAIKSHISIAEKFAKVSLLTNQDEENNNSAFNDLSELWQGSAGEALANLISELINPIFPDIEINISEYSYLLDILLAQIRIKPPYDKNPKIYIWGALEARLQTADIMIVSQFSETIWPQNFQSDPWLSIGLKSEIGLEPPERRLGLIAHDISEFLCTNNIYITRSMKKSSTPMLPSRWLLRLQTVLKKLGLLEALKPEYDYLQLARKLRSYDNFEPISRPNPKPPYKLRPRRLSVSDIERLIRDPYEILQYHSFYG